MIREVATVWIRLPQLGREDGRRTTSSRWYETRPLLRHRGRLWTAGHSYCLSAEKSAGATICIVVQRTTRYRAKSMGGSGSGLHCPTGARIWDAFHVAAQIKIFLAGKGVDLTAPQEAKTSTALAALAAATIQRESR